MSVTRIKNGFEGWQKYKPAGLTHQTFKDLQCGTVLDDSYVQGSVITKFPVTRHKDGSLLKVIIQEAIGEETGESAGKLGPSQLQVFVIGNITKHWANIDIGEYICICDVKVEGVPKKTPRLVVEDDKTRPPRIWVFKKTELPSPPAPKTNHRSTAAASTTTKQEQPKQQKYTYTLLKTLKAATTVNVWGVIKFHKPPVKSRGTDYAQTLGIVDPSLTGERKVVCQFFAPRPEKLPNDVETGQIIRLHRLRITMYNGTIQGGSGPGYSWVIFDPNTQATYEPVATSSVKYSLSDSDKDKVKELRKWLKSDQCSVELPTAGATIENNANHSDTNSGAEDVINGANDRRLNGADEWIQMDDDLSDQNKQAKRTKRVCASVKAPLTLVPLQPATNQHPVNGPRNLATPADQELQKEVFTQIKDFRHKALVNVMGVVTFVKPVTQTVKKEYLKVITIVDQTSQMKLKCLLFSEKLDQLPESVFVGQVICFRRICISRYHNEWQGQRISGFSWCLFDSCQGECVKLVDFSSNCNNSNVNRDKISVLQQWAEQERLLRYQLNSKISHIQPEQYFDLVCQVIGSRVEEPDECMLVRVWDGTEPLIPLKQASTEVNPLSADHMLEEQSFGLTVDIYVYEDHYRSAACLKPGDYVAFTNLHSAPSKFGINDAQQEEMSSVRLNELCLHRGTTYSRGLRYIDPRSDLLAAVVQARLCDTAPGPSHVTSPRRTKCTDGRKRRRSSGLALVVTDDDEYIIDEDVEDDDQSPPSKLVRPASPKTNGRRRSGRLSPGGHSPGRHSPSPSGHHSPRQPPDQPDKTINGEAVQSGSSGDTPRCLQESATVLTDHHHIKVTPLCEVIRHPAPYKFRIKVQLIDYVPREPHRLNKLFCPRCHHMQEAKADSQRRRSQRLGILDQCPKCSNKSDSENGVLNEVMVLELLLCDKTGFIRAHLWGDEAETFFTDLSSPSDVPDCLEQLCPPPSEENGKQLYRRPWMEACVATYQSAGETCFHIFDTMLAINDA